MNKKKKRKNELTRLMCGAGDGLAATGTTGGRHRGLVASVEHMFTFGFKYQKLFKRLYVWDFLERACSELESLAAHTPVTAATVVTPTTPPLAAASSSSSSYNQQQQQHSQQQAAVAADNMIKMMMLNIRHHSPPPPPQQHNSNSSSNNNNDSTSLVVSIGGGGGGGANTSSLNSSSASSGSSSSNAIVVDKFKSVVRAINAVAGGVYGKEGRFRLFVCLACRYIHILIMRDL
jgi:type II secretory pathway pseudopilin PulG